MRIKNLVCLAAGYAIVKPAPSFVLTRGIYAVTALSCVISGNSQSPLIKSEVGAYNRTTRVSHFNSFLGQHLECVRVTENPLPSAGAGSQLLVQLAGGYILYG